MKHLTTATTILVLVTLAFSPAELTAQPGIVTLTKGRVMAVLDTLSGRFSAMRSDGKTLLFASEIGLTSHISVVVDDAIWTNFRKSQMTAQWPIRNLERGRVEMRTDRIRYTWEVRARSGKVRIIQELEPVSDSTYEEVRIHLLVENTGTRAIETGVTIMEDVDADGDDHVTLREIAKPVTRERVFTGAETPERLMMLSSAFLPDSAHCRFKGLGVTVPDMLTVGKWTYHGFLGTAVYGYAAKDQYIGDVAILSQWSKRAVAPGAGRRESTAIGFTAPLPENPEYSMFAREFVIPMSTNHVMLTIVCDSVARATISAPYADASYENLGSRDGSWDTLVIISPDEPACLQIHLDHRSPQQVDSIRYYRQLFASVHADKEIAICIRPHVIGGAIDASSVLPVAEWDTVYLCHGVLNTCNYSAQNAGTENTITLYRTIEYFWNWHSYYPSGNLEPILPWLRWTIPARGTFRFSPGGDGRPWYDHWTPTPLSDRNLTIDGTGDILSSSEPVLLMYNTNARLWPGYDNVPTSEPRIESRYFHHPVRKQLGTEYIFVPFWKRKAKQQEDFVRIIAYEDGTDITLYDGTPAIHLDRTGHVDTLLSQPTVIRSSKPVAVYQHHLTWWWLESDTTYAGGALPLLPHGLWGRRYYAVSDDVYKPNVMPLLPFPFRDHALYYDNLYFILITKAAHRDDVLINDVPVDPARFTVFGDWACAYVDILPDFHIVRSDYPFLAISCGGGGGSFGKYYGNFGVSFIPPYR